MTPPETGGGFAIAGLILGIVSIPIALFAICGYITSILGILFSLVGLRALSKRPIATSGLVLSGLGLIASIVSSMVGVLLMQHPYPITQSGLPFGTATPTAYGPTRATGTFSVSGFGGSVSDSYATSKGDALTIWADSTGSHVHIGVTGYNGDMWTLDFGAPGTVEPINGKPAVLVPGTYSGAHRYPFNGNGPGLDLSGLSSGCNTLTGSFTIMDAVFGPPGYVQKFDATFVQHCEGGPSATTGEVHLSNPPAG
jgi:hypothetical protein